MARLMVIISLGVVVCGPPHGHYLVRSGCLFGVASWSLFRYEWSFVRSDPMVIISLGVVFC